MKIIIKTLMILLLVISLKSLGQSNYYDSNIDPKWVKYYTENPSGIETNYSASDFIKVIDKVHFIPVKKLYNNNDNRLLKSALLRLDYQDFEQLKIDGKYFAITKNHDLYFEIYNSHYYKISKYEWDRLCPYLIPLMNVDGVIKLN